MMTLPFVLKITAVLASGLAAAWLARSSRAAVRHVLLAASFAMLVLLPVLSSIAPSVNVSVPTSLGPVVEFVAEDPAFDESSLNTAARPVMPPERSTAAEWRWPAIEDVLFLGWIAGAVICLVPVVV